MLAGRFDEQFPRVLAEMLSQEIEAVLNRGEVGFRWRKFQPAFAQKLHHKRFDLVCQEFRRTPCNDESSSAGESHPRALSDPDVNLSAHPAPIVQPQAVPPSANA